MKVSEFVYQAVKKEMQTNKLNDSQSQFINLFDVAFKKSFEQYFKQLMLVQNRSEFNTRVMLKVQDIFMQHLKVPQTKEELNVSIIPHPIIEKAEEAFDEEEAIALEKQLRKQEFDLDDYLAQLRQIKKMGSFSSILKMLPGANKLGDIKVDDREFIKIEAMICSMTKKERRNPKVLNGSRRQRIAKGSGTTVQDINKFIKSFELTQKMMKQMNNKKGGMKNMMKNLNMNDLKNFKI